MDLSVVSASALQLLVERISVGHRCAHKCLLGEGFAIENVLVPRHLCSCVKLMHGVLWQRSLENLIGGTVAARCRWAKSVLRPSNEPSMCRVKVAVVLELPAAGNLWVNVFAKKPRASEPEIPSRA